MKKFLALSLAAIMLFSMALAEAPIVESVLTENDVDVNAGTPETIFTIDPNGTDFNWELYRLEDGEWAPATVTLSNTTPLRGFGTAGGDIVTIQWDYWYNGDYTGYDGGIEHRLDVLVNGVVVSSFTFYANYFMNHSFDRISLLSWYENQDGDLTTARHVWYSDNHVNSFGPKFADSWMTYSVVDLSIQGTQTFDLVAAGAWKLGTVSVTVNGDEVVVNYLCDEDINTRDVHDDIFVDREWFTLFGDLASVTTLNPDEIETAYTFGAPISIANDLGGDTVVILYVNNVMTYDHSNPYVTRFWPNLPENKAIVEAMTTLLGE